MYSIYVTACVKTLQGVMNTFDTGVCQSCKLSALLFSLFLNNIQKKLQSTQVVGFEIGNSSIHNNMLCLATVSMLCKN